MSKSDFIIKKISKSDAVWILKKYHYLTEISKGFKSGYNYGLYKGGEHVGVCIFTGFPVPELSKGMLGLDRNDQDGLFELSRLCLIPTIQSNEHNITSWFVSRCIKALKSDAKVRVILSYADSDFHEGVIYKACNFTYYGLTAHKKDFWIKKKDGVMVKHTRGKVKGIEGEWRDRSRKHRFVMLFDKNLNISWGQVSKI